MSERLKRFAPFASFAEAIHLKCGADAELVLHLESVQNADLEQEAIDAFHELIVKGVTVYFLDAKGELSVRFWDGYDTAIENYVGGKDEPSEWQVATLSRLWGEAKPLFQYCCKERGGDGPLIGCPLMISADRNQPLETSWQAETESLTERFRNDDFLATLHRDSLDSREKLEYFAKLQRDVDKELGREPPEVQNEVYSSCVTGK